MNKPRTDVKQEDKWNVEVMYPDLKTWQKEFANCVDVDQKPRWPSLRSFQGRLHESPETLKDALETQFDLGRKLHTLYTYAHLRHDEDITQNETKTAYNQILGILFDFQEECSWFEPELLALPESTIQQYLTSPQLSEYQFYLEKILRMKSHTLTPDQEQLIALAGKAMQAPGQAFSAINDADFKFGYVKDSEGNEIELTHGSFAICLRSHDRSLRHHAFTQMHEKYESYENTLCELISGQVQAHLFEAKARKFDSCLDAALFPKNIDTSVYHSLIEAVTNKIDTLHQYIQLREKILDVGPLGLHDMYVPLTSEIDITMPYKEAEEVIIESVAPLGEEYQSLLKKGLQDQRWVDRYENLHKRSGAYSSGCYDSSPFILMNYKELLRDVFTLAHEAGHSMHSLLSHKNQSYQYGDYPIFLAEVASTFNEDLLTRTLLDRAQTKEEKIYLINQKIEDIRSTLFRQTMFAEFELMIHELVEKNIRLTPTLLKQEFRKLNQKYFGKTVVIDEVADIEWARIPHFYYNFYVYQYATGISAALALSDRVCNGGEQEREDYLGFLRSGCSRYPIDILKSAGVDMTTAQPVMSAIDKFGGLVKELDALL